jgi:HK97 family phage major capsid protein
MTTETAPTLKSVADSVEKLTGVVKALAEKPDFSKVFYDEDGQPVGAGHWADSGESMDVTIASEPGRGARDGSLKSARARTRTKSLYKQFGYKPNSEFKSVGDFIRYGVENRNTPGVIQERMAKHLAPIMKAVQGMSARDGDSAGVTIMPEFNNQIIDRVYSNDLLSRTDGYTVASNNMTFLANAETSRATGSRHGGMQGYWIGEGGTITKSKPTFRTISLKLNKLAVVVYLTEELLSDTAQALEQYVVRKAAEEFNFMIGDAIFNGTGVGQPLGVFNAPSLISIAAEAGQTPDTLQTENIEKMYARFYAPNLPAARWYHNQDIRPQLNTMSIGVGTGGQVVYMPPGGLAEAPHGMLLGNALDPIEFAATLGDQGDITLADLKQMLSISKGGMAQAVSAHIEFLTDQLAVKLTMRLDVRPWESAPITPYKGPSNTQSSFVTLDAR